MGEFLADLSPWLTHGAVFVAGIVVGVVADIMLVYRSPEDLRGD